MISKFPEQLMIDCRYGGYHRDSFRWIQEGDYLYAEVRIQADEQGQLFIEPVECGFTYVPPRME